ncbi:MAG: DUF4652 domain-containing protein [Peptostreptococcaceae bacterium]
MKCNQCKDKLTEYIEGNLSAEEDEEIKSHLLTCNSCKIQYDSEVLEYKAFKEAFSYENMDFKNSTDKIMSKIDRNRYVKGRIKMKRKYKGPLTVAAAFLLGVIVTSSVMGIMRNNGLNLSAASDGSDKMEESSAINDTAKSAENKLTDEANLGATASKEDLKSVEYAGVYNKNAIEMYLGVEVPTSTKLTFNTPFMATENKQYVASIEGKGETAIEEGPGKIYIKDTVANKMYEYSVKDTNSQDSPLSISWYDDNNLMIVHGSAYGTLVNGSNIVVVNVTTGEQILIATAGEKEGYKSIEKSGEDLVLKYVLYTDDAMNNYEDKEKIVPNYILGDVIK